MNVYEKPTKQEERKKKSTFPLPSFSLFGGMEGDR